LGRGGRHAPPRSGRCRRARGCHRPPRPRTRRAARGVAHGGGRARRRGRPRPRRSRHGPSHRRAPGGRPLPGGRGSARPRRPVVARAGRPAAHRHPHPLARPRRGPRPSRGPSGEDRIGRPPRRGPRPTGRPLAPCRRGRGRHRRPSEPRWHTGRGPPRPPPTRGLAVASVHGIPPTRTTVVWVPDWPVVAAGRRPDRPVAVLRANRVIAASPAARAEGVVPDQRRREAQARCPELEVLDHDPSLDARAFEPVVAAVETVTPLIEIVEPGLCAFATRGPSRYHGGDLAMMTLVEQPVTEELGARATVRTGTADGPFAARLAAQLDPAAQCDLADSFHLGARVVPAGDSAAFLAPLPVTALDRPELTSVLGRLGLVTLGHFAALDPRDV